MWKLLIVMGILAICFVLLTYPRQETVHRWPVSDLPKYLLTHPNYKGKVEILFPHPIEPMGNFYSFSPSIPSSLSPITYKLSFRRLPTKQTNYLISGYCQGLQVDGAYRITGVPGYVLLTDCVVLK